MADCQAGSYNRSAFETQFPAHESVLPVAVALLLSAGPGGAKAEEGKMAKAKDVAPAGVVATSRGEEFVTYLLRGGGCMFTSGNARALVGAS